MAKTATRTIDLEPIDRLEEKLKLLVGMVERLKAEQAEASAENERLARELDRAERTDRVERHARDRAHVAQARSVTSSARGSARCSNSSNR